MAGILEFSDDDWRELLAELRILVAGSGFIEWDAVMATVLDEPDPERSTPRDRLRYYVWRLVTLLKLQSSENINRMRAQLMGLVRTRDGTEVQNVVVVDEERQRHTFLFETGASDGLLEAVIAFANAISGDGDDRYFDDWSKI